MSAPFIDIKKFTIIPGTIAGRYTHKLQKATLLGDARVFYQKEMESRTIACLEILAQEFFRLIIPSQPETLIAYNPVLNTYFILSEEIPGYKHLPQNSQKEFTKGSYPGLGQVMVISILLQEIDLKNGNIGLNKNNQVVKIDGDWCFAAIRSAPYKDYKKNITPELLSSLPFPFGYTAFNWLDISSEGVVHQSSKIVNEHLTNASHFRKEINEAILKIILLPDSYIRNFVDAYIPTSIQANVFINFLKARREELKLAALQDESFKLYLNSEAAEETVDQHVLHLNTFVANGSHSIIKPQGYDTLSEEIGLMYKELHCSVEPTAKGEYTLTNALEELNKLSISRLSSKTTKTLMLKHRDQLLMQINSYIELINKPSSQYNAFIQLADEKKREIETSTHQLEQRFNILEQMNFDNYIKGFTKKQKEMILKALHNSNYREASKQAGLFCMALTQARKNFLALDKTLDDAKSNFKKECLLAVRDARGILDNHREWSGRIKKFIMDVLSLLTMGWLNSTRLGLFGKTDSAIKLNNLEELVSYNIK